MFQAQASRAFAGAYRAVGVETGVSQASPHRLIALLFEGFNDAVTDARAAMHRRDIEAKGKAVRRGVRIVEEGLKGGLDVRAGGKLAADLDALYGYVAQRLTEAHLRNDPALLDECVALIEPVKSAWAAIGAEAGKAAQLQ